MHQGPPARTVGARLREAREKQGVSLRQIANTTRISVMSLEALERSDLARLPGGIFTRAFIRAYAQEVGLDPDRTVRDFIAELPGDATTTGHSGALEDGQKLESGRRAIATATRLALVSVPIVAAMAYYGAQRTPAEEQTPARIAAATGSDALQGPWAGEGARAAGDGARALSAASDLRLEIAPKASCWVSVTADGDQTFSVLMTPGEKRIVTAKEQILISVGDAGAFAYSLNGQTGLPLGAPGEVVSKRITLSNLNEFVAP